MHVTDSRQAPLPPPSPASTHSKRRRRRIVATAVFAIVLCAAYAFWPRAARLRSFDPDEVARIDAQAWRHYYEKNYVRLTRDLYRLCRRQLGASPARSLQIGWQAARAARVFQKSRSREQAREALPYLERYYNIIRTVSGESFATDEAARLELEWWQQRRENIPPEEYARPMAACAAVLYGVFNDDIRLSAEIRARMMAWRDARGGAMTDDDWRHIAGELRRATRHFHAGVQQTARAVSPPRDETP
ncbi:MAG: hypothetical protein LBK99_19730 [Opitutaceae bacterium]|nr:hypothetical protein [Opitutaceae bacterium]